MMKRLVIIGNGLAGSFMAEEMRRYDPNASEWEISMFGREAHLPYNRIRISSLLAQDCERDNLDLHSAEWWTEHRINIYLSETVIDVNLAKKYIVTDQNREFSYDILIFATGSSPFLPYIEKVTSAEYPAIEQRSPPTKTMQYSKIFPFRTVDDCLALLSVTTSRSTDASAPVITVMGAGFVGIEIALALATYGLEINLVHPHDIILEKNLDLTGGKIFQRLVETENITVLTARIVEKLLPDRIIQLDDGTQIYADILVISAGIRPNIQLASQVGIQCNYGIIVDDHLLTSVPEVYAIGECAEHAGLVYALVQPAWDQAKILARQLLSQKASYRGSDMVLRLKSRNFDLLSLGETQASIHDNEYEVIQLADPHRGRYCKIVIMKHRIVGAVIIGFPQLIPQITQLYDQRTLLSNDPAQLILGKNSTATPVEELPDTVIICVCNSVSKGELRAAWQTGAHTTVELSAVTRAGTGCGNCTSTLATLNAYWSSQN